MDTNGSGLTRKDFLAGAIGAGVTAATARAAALPVRRDPRYRDAILTRLPADDHIWSLERRLADVCPIFTGSAGHRADVDLLAGELAAAGLAPQRRTERAPYWEPHRWSLTLEGAAVPVTGYRPHSGSTGPDGVEGALAYAGMGGRLDFGEVGGKIVLIDVPFVGAPGNDTEVVGVYPPGERAAFAYDEPTPLWTGMRAPSYDAAIKGGAIGVVYIWNGVSDANAMDQMQPFFGPPSAIPALWVGTAAGARLKAAAGKRARLTLDATVHPDTPSDTIWAVVPGTGDEVVIVNSHNDGCNACEENGGIAVVSLARAMAALPAAQRRRTHVFLATTGHFSHGFIRGAENWQKANPELMRRAVACVTIEHLGATEWRDDAAGRYRPTGKYQWGMAIAPTKAMGDVVAAAAASLDVQRTVTLRPRGRRYPGEGSSFWAAGIPTLSYICGPDYTMAAPAQGGELARLSRSRMLDQIRMFARCLETIETLDRAALTA